MTSERLFSDQRLAEILHEACGDKKSITSSEYTKWYNSKEATPMKYPKNFQTFVNRLGKGRVPDTFKRMRELLGLPEEEPGESSKKKKKKQINDPGSKLEQELATNCYKLVNTLGYGFYIGHAHIEVEQNSWHAIIERTQRSTAQRDIVISSQLKLAQDINGQLVDFPAPKEGVFYLIDAKLYREMQTKGIEERYDFIPVFHKDNYPPEYRPPIPSGLHIYLK